MSHAQKEKIALGKENQTYQLKVGDKAKVKMPDGSIRVFQVVWKGESDPLNGMISNESPVGRALVGAVAGEKRSYRVISNGEEKIFQLEILEIYPKEEK
ncbi:MAG: hypothetical protein KatS3mg098_210 [Candidatus Parcubacteria bacterium]|nr:MAG: hypothetical protein KatS3mg098_210 [Candidatus Parcubacteria bacterium]